jgi:hypothetical protein
MSAMYYDTNSTYIVYSAACHLFKGRDSEGSLPNRELTPPCDHRVPIAVLPECGQPPHWEFYLTAKSEVVQHLLLYYFV